MGSLREFPAIPFIKNRLRKSNTVNYAYYQISFVMQLVFFSYSFVFFLFWFFDFLTKFKEFIFNAYEIQ